MHKTKFLPFAGVYNIRCLFVRNVIHDTTFGKRDQYIINLFAGQSGTYGQGCFADIGIVGEYSGVRAENRLYSASASVPISRNLYSSSRRIVKRIREALSCSSVYSR